MFHPNSVYSAAGEITKNLSFFIYKIRTKQRTHYCYVYMADTFQAFPLPDIFIWKRAMKFGEGWHIKPLDFIRSVPWNGEKKIWKYQIKLYSLVMDAWTAVVCTPCTLYMLHAKYFHINLRRVVYHRTSTFSFDDIGMWLNVGMLFWWEGVRWLWL